MSHIRKQIRYAFKDLLTGLTGIGQNVFTNRVDPIETGEIPALTIQIDDDQADEVTNYVGGGGSFNRVIPVTVSIYQVGDTVDDDLDDFAELVEQAVSGDTTLGGLVANVIYQSTNIETERAEQIKGVAQIQFTCDTFHENF
jgi:hypothetical protein